MHRIITNRALGILKLFLQEYPDKKRWALPATICFSVPALFYAMKKEILFYDFFIDNTNLLQKNILKNCEGVLIVDYYGTEKTGVEVFSILKEKNKIIIYDKCLSTPSLSLDNHLRDYVDLTLYSTGHAKVVNLNYGGFGICRHKLYPEKISEEVNRNYLKLDKGWNDTLKAKNKISIHALRKTNWVDICDNLVVENYEQGVKKLRNLVLKEKNKINKMYRATIPSELFHPDLSDIWRFQLMIKNRDFLLNEIFLNKLFASSHYPDMSVHFNFKKKLNNSNMIEKHILNLFNDHFITMSQAEKCAELIKILFHQKKIKNVPYKV